MPGMYYYFDPTYILVLIGAGICILASANVNATFKRYSKQPCRRGITGAMAAETILRGAGIMDVRIEHVRGNLTDHYSPQEKVLRLSDSVYGSNSVAAVGVAAHECGHAIQHQVGYAPIRLRNAIVPVVNLGSMLSWPVIVAGLIFSSLQMLHIGILLFSFTLLFQIVTLPVEFDASGRAMKILSKSGMLYDEEARGARKVLTAAGLTYVTATVSTLLQLLRLILLFGRRDD